MDRETVITHLLIIHTWASFARERDLQFFTEKHFDSIIAWTDEALAMLKEYESKELEEKEKHPCEKYKESGESCH